MFFRFALGRFVNRPYGFWRKFYILPVGEGSPLPRMTIPPSFSCENATSLYTREAFFWFSFCYLVSSFLIVGDDILGVPFIKISLCFERTTNGRPYGFDCFPKINACRGGVSPPDKFMQKREAKRLPYGRNIEIYDKSCRDRRPRRS